VIVQRLKELWKRPAVGFQTSIPSSRLLGPVWHVTSKTLVKNQRPKRQRQAKMASTKVVSRLSTRLQPFLFKLNKKSLSAELSSLKSSSLPTPVSVPATTRRLSRSSR